MTSNFDEDDLIYSVPEGCNIPDTIDVSPSAGILNLNSETKELTTQIESNIDIYIDHHSFLSSLRLNICHKLQDLL